MLKPIIREAQIILILETCLMNNQKVYQKELFIIRRMIFKGIDYGLCVEHVSNESGCMHSFENYEHKILEVLDLNND